jgi:prefoldin subunit 5
MTTLAELEAAFNTFLEKAQQLQTDVQEVQAAQEALDVAQATLTKEEEDVGETTVSICSATETLTGAIEDYVTTTLGVNCG